MKARDAGELAQKLAPQKPAPRQSNSRKVARKVARKMVHWYDPLLLIRTGVRSLLATSVGQITDNRELQTASQRGRAASADYSSESELWLDFVADIGDGFESTHAIAQCLAAPTLSIPAQEAQDAQTEDAQARVGNGGSQLELPRAGVVVCGGDLVYPDPSIATYLEATFEPYTAACREVDSTPGHKADFFALPGNHDWYDGLQAFEDLLCHDDPDDPQWPLGHWRKPQTHSYFGLRLPHNWWLLGIDFQLDGRINPSQRAFFDDLITQMDPGARVIACVATPFWTLKHTTNETDSVRRISELCARRGATVHLVLTGDLHHYSRYGNDTVTSHQADPPGVDRTQTTYITAGGGGAFLHPTHSLPPKSQVAQNLTLKHCYPSKSTSRWLSLHNLKFPALNWEISLLAGFLYTLLAWTLETRFIRSDTSLAESFQRVLNTHTGVWSELRRLLAAIPQSPEFALIVLLALGALVSFNGQSSTRQQWALGITHTLFHLLGLCITYCLAIELTIWFERNLMDLGFAFLWLLLTMLVLGGGVGGVVFGVFLIVSSVLFNANVTNAFSSIRLASHKNFLRLRFDPSGQLTLYSLGLERPADGVSGLKLIDRIVFDAPDECVDPARDNPATQATGSSNALE